MLWLVPWQQTGLFFFYFFLLFRHIKKFHQCFDAKLYNLFKALATLSRMLRSRRMLTSRIAKRICFSIIFRKFSHVEGMRDGKSASSPAINWKIKIGLRKRISPVNFKALPSLRLHVVVECIKQEFVRSRDLHIFRFFLLEKKSGLKWGGFGMLMKMPLKQMENSVKQMIRFFLVAFSGNLMKYECVLGLTFKHFNAVA